LCHSLSPGGGKCLKSDHDGLLPNHCIIFLFHCTKSSRHRLTFNSQLTCSESESELLHDRLFTANHFVLATSPFRLTTSNFIFQLNICGYSPYVTSSLTRGWVCRLQLFLVLASAVPRAHDHILGSQIPCRSTSPCLYPPGTGWPGYTPRHWVPFTSPPTTSRATVEVFDPASTRRYILSHIMVTRQVINGFSLDKSIY
jgi:hypothetical protein